MSIITELVYYIEEKNLIVKLNQCRNIIFGPSNEFIAKIRLILEASLKKYMKQATQKGFCIYN